MNDSKDPFDDPAWKAADQPTRRSRERNAHHVGFPVEWLKRVLPLVHSKDQVAIAMWLHRRRAVCRSKGSEAFTVPNHELYEELGLSRYTKYRTLRHLEAAGVIMIVKDGNQTLNVRLL